MNKTQELIKVINENPKRELIFMYPDECSDHLYTMGRPSKILVDKYAIINDRVWFKGEDEDELFDELADNFSCDYPGYPLTDEENKEVEEKAKVEMESLNWKEAIIVYIAP